MADFHAVKFTCNATDDVFMMSNTLHHCSITEGHDLKTIFPGAACYKKVLRWGLQCCKALWSKLNVFSQMTPNFTR